VRSLTAGTTGGRSSAAWPSGTAQVLTQENALPWTWSLRAGQPGLRDKVVSL
jgi:hypothetical protein